MIQCCPFYPLHWPLTLNTLVCARPHQRHINGMVFMTTLMRYSLEALLVSIDNPRIIFGLSGHPSSYRCLSNGVVAHVMMRRQLPFFQAVDANLGDICCHLHQGCTGQPFLLRGGAGQGENAQGGVTVKPWAWVGRGILENFRGRGAPGQAFPPGSGRSGAGRASLIAIR